MGLASSGWSVPSTATAIVTAGGGQVVEKAAEGEYRPGPYCLDGGWLSATAGRLMNWWQCGYSIEPLGACNAMVEACVSSYSQTIAMCPGDHWRSTGDGGRKRVTTSDLSRILRRPNDYQSISDLLLNLTERLYRRGEAFGVVLRNGRFEAAELHLMQYGWPTVAVDGSIFYNLSGNEIVERRVDMTQPIPARDVLHVRLHTPRHPLKGVSPILANALDLALSGAALNQQVAFYLNSARPSFMLSTDQLLNKTQAQELRDRWKEQTTGENAGGTPILTAGLKAQPVVINPHDAQLAELLKMSDANIALAFRIPLQMFGLGGASVTSTEALMQMWVATGLGFALNHIEEAFGLTFGLKGQPDDYLEFDTAALLRSNFKDRMEGLARAVQGAIYAPDEARATEQLPRVAGGHGAMPRAQQQLVPLSYGTNLQPPTPAAPAAPQDPANEPDDDEGEDGDAEAERAVRAFRASNDRHLSLAA